MSTLARKVYEVGTVSNSEVSSYLTCPRRHYYIYGTKLEPVTQSTSLTRGIIGHEALATYYKARKNDVKHDVAVDLAISVVEGYILKDLTENFARDTEWLTNLMIRLKEYLTWCQSQDKFRILEVEKRFSLPLPSGEEYVMVLDLLVQMTSGPYVGELVLIDHKFVTDFHTESELAMNAQLPKYLGILHANGINASHAILNQIRMRFNKSKPMQDTDKFRRDPVTPTKKEIETIFREELKTASKLQFLKSLPLEEWEAETVRNMNQLACKNCPFVLLCKADLQGQDTRLMRLTEYKPIDFSYRTQNDDDV